LKDYKEHKIKMECKKIGFFEKSFALKEEKHDKAKIE
jgi:hypothetical protein